MAIRFTCPGCRQPIEIDDEWSGRLVACPFCRNTVSAPDESTLVAGADVPMATPVANAGASALSGTLSAENGPGDDVWSAPDRGIYGPPTAERGTRSDAVNRLAMLGLASAVLSLACVIGMVAVATVHVRDIYGGIPGQDVSQEDAMRNYREFFATVPPPGWVYWMVALMGAGGVTWVAAVILGSISLSRPGGRVQAIAALTLSGLMLVTLCCLGALGMVNTSM